MRRRVLVTGAAGGLGRAIVTALGEQDWTVIATDRDGPGLEALRADHRDVPHVQVRALDVTDEDAVAALAAGLGTLTGLVNVAGVLQAPAGLRDLDPEVHRTVWEVNYFGAVRCTRLFAPLMDGDGRVVNITSVNELSPLPLYAYAPAKVALGCFTRLAAGELAARGIRVNAVAPGFTLTPAFADKIRDGERDQAVIERHTAAGRLVRPAEVAAAVTFLLSDAAGAITGTTLPVDGGWLATAHWMDFGDRLGTHPTMKEHR